MGSKWVIGSIFAPRKNFKNEKEVPKLPCFKVISELLVEISGIEPPTGLRPLAAAADRLDWSRGQRFLAVPLTKEESHPYDDSLSWWR